jgi:hypothetical protein
MSDTMVMKRQSNWWHWLIVCVLLTMICTLMSVKIIAMGYGGLTSDRLLGRTGTTNSHQVLSRDGTTSSDLDVILLGNAINLTAKPSNTSISLNWTKAPGSLNTIIRYSTLTYPSDPTDGTAVYNGSGIQTTLSGLTAGQTYYFSAWGDDPPYSTTPAHLVMTTTAVSIPSGATPPPVATNLPIPGMPAISTQEPDPSGLNLEPFTSIIKYFNEAPGGWGMPNKYAWETLYTIFIVFIAIAVYMKVHNFFIAWGFLILLTMFGVGLDLTQGMLVVVEIVVALGVWGIEQSSQ